MLAPKKSLGQNFLHDESAIAKIVDSLEIVEGDTIIEIGPGRGALTKHLLKKGARKVIAIEKDSNLVVFLRDGLGRCIENGSFEVIEDDFLNWEAPDTPHKIVGNIPFYITGAILRHVLDSRHHPSVMTLLMQKEVAERIVLADGKNSILGTAVNIYCRPKIIATVKPGAFFPPPNVTSAIITFTDFKNPFEATKDRCAFFDFVHQIFSGKRKTLATNLKDIYDRTSVLAGLEKANLGDKVRAEDMSAEQIYTLYQTLNPQ
jgi:16S rRNA (adenine1518-N6/adenine1519-N6)-dimethyltransferase